MIITALGVLKDRIGQKGRWQQRRRLPTLRSRLADCITIGDDLEAEGVRRALVRTMKGIESKIARGKRIAALMDAIKLQVGGWRTGVCESLTTLTETAMENKE